MEDKSITLEEFQALIQQVKEDDAILHLARKYMLHGIPYVFCNNENAYYDFRNRIADHFEISYRDVYIVGSAKLGFSYFRGTPFTLDSDIDVAIVNAALFESYMKCICEFQYEYNKTVRLTYDEYKKYNKFLSYLAKGWFRADKLPHKDILGEMQDKWFDYFRTLSYGNSEVGNYEVTCGLYKGYFYLEKYITNSIKQLQNDSENSNTM